MNEREGGSRGGGGVVVCIDSMGVFVWRAFSLDYTVVVEIS